jgi:type I restriction enzyme, S subunit
VRLKRVAHIKPGQSPPSTDVEPFDGEGIPFLQGNAEFDEEVPLPRLRCSTAPKFAQPGDLLVSVRAPVGAINLADRTYGIGRGLAAVTPSALNSRFCWWWLHSAVSLLRSVATGSTYEAVTAEDIGSLLVPGWSARKQRAIADFLDTETARIDALINKKRRLIDLLEERFGSYLREKLAPLKPKRTLKRRWQVIDCKHRTPEYVSEGYPVVSPGDVMPGRLDLRRAHRFVGIKDYHDLADPLRRPHRGDIIYSRNASIGIAAYVDTEEAFCMGQDVCLITSSDQDQLYLTYVLNSVGMDQLEMHKIGSTFSRVNISQIVDLDVPVPEPAAQRSLGEQFDAQRRRCDALVGSLTRQIALLQEHRQALITAAVTGELDIPGAVA